MKKKLMELFLKKRVKILLNLFDLKGASILDMGGYDGRYMDYIKKECPDITITIADYDEKGLAIARQKGYNTISLDGSKEIEFQDGQFDLVFCNSVIEHVTIPKNEIWEVKSTAEFRERSFAIQKHFASEIMRIGKNYFVQTPNRYFPMEHHSWLPFVQFLSRKNLIPFLRFTNKFWIKKTTPDWNLLTASQMQELFPDGKIRQERLLLMPKSIIAYKNQR